MSEQTLIRKLVWALRVVDFRGALRKAFQSFYQEPSRLLESKRHGDRYPHLEGQALVVKERYPQNVTALEI